MAAASLYGSAMPFLLASSNFISGSSVPSRCTCSSHLGMPAMKSRRSLMTTSCQVAATADKSVPVIPKPAIQVDQGKQVYLIQVYLIQVDLQRIRHRCCLAVGKGKLRDMSETNDEASIGAQRCLPIVALGEDHPCPDDIGAGRAHQSKRCGETGASGHDVVDDRDAPPGEQRRGAAVEHKALLAGGRYRLNFLHQGVGQVDLRRLLGDDILVEAKRARDFDNDRDAERRCADDDVGLERAEL